MPEMKNSEIEWIKDIPTDWEVSPLKYNYYLVAGATPDSSNMSMWDGEINWITPADYKTKDIYVEEGARKLSELGYKSCSTTIVPAGSIIFSKRAPIGSVAINKQDLCTNQGCLSLVSKNKSVNNKFFYYVISVYDDVFNLFGSGTTFKEISATVFGNVMLPYPPKKIQDTIVIFLDSKCAEIDALIADIQSEIETLEEYKKSVIFGSICHGINADITMKNTDSDVWSEIPEGWELKNIKYMFEIVKRIAGKEGYDVLSVTQKGLKVKDITSGDGQLADSYAGYQLVYPTDYVMNHMDLLTGWVDLSTMFGVTSPDYRVFRLKDKASNSLDYYKYVMQCCYMNKIFYSLGQGVSNLGRWRLQTSSFNNFKVPVPPISEQMAIADYLNHVIEESNGIIDMKKEQLTTLEEYKKSVIYEYVTGKKEVPSE